MSDEPTTPDPTQDEVDAALEEADILRRIERRLLHVDRTTEESLVQIRTGNTEILSLVVMVAIVGAMVWLLSRELKGFDLGDLAP